MIRHDIIDRVGSMYLRGNIENSEWSYVQDAGSMAELERRLGYKPTHFKLDLRFTADSKFGTIAVLVETKQKFTKADEKQLAEYVALERALHPKHKIVCILANTNDDKVKVWRNNVSDDCVEKIEQVIDTMQHYVNFFDPSLRNDRETVMKNTYALNEALHKLDIDEAKRSQFVGTCLLYIKDVLERKTDAGCIWRLLESRSIVTEIEAVLDRLLDNQADRNKRIKVELLQKNVLNDQKVKALKTSDWRKILDAIYDGIYLYINADSSEGQDILNLFFITFNKYTGKADKNQAFTPDHITDFMVRLTGLDKNWHARVLDPTCGSGSFLVQAMVKEFEASYSRCTEEEANRRKDLIKRTQIFGIECEEKAYGLATTNMLIHGDGNSNIEFGSCFDKKDFIKKAAPKVILMNPPYNAKPRSIPAEYQVNWGNAKTGKEDPTKGLVFVKYLSDIAVEEGWQDTKLAVLLPMSAAIGTSKIIAEMKADLLENNTLEAVFSLPAEIFYPGATVQACCMLFTLNKPHFNADGTPVADTFFGYYKEDGFKKKKNLGRVEQFDADGKSKWKEIETQWLDLYRNRRVVPGLSAMVAVTGDDEWLCEAYMKTDYSKLTEADFQKTLTDYLAYLVKTGMVTEP